MKSTHDDSLAGRGVLAVKRYFEIQGYEVLDINWAHRGGSIDIVAMDGEQLVFCKVSTYRAAGGGFKPDDLSDNARDSFERCALVYLVEHVIVDVPVRFDIVSVGVVADDRAMVRHLKDAFAI